VSNVKSKHIKAVIFDFDSTIADSFEVFVRAIEVVLKRSRPLTSREIDDLRKCSLREVMKKLQLPLLVIKGRHEIDRQMDRVEIFRGMPEAIKGLSKKGYKLYIVSSHAEQSMNEFLEKNKIAVSMTRVYGNIGLWGKPKGLKRLQRQEGFSADECLFVGDEIRDIEAAAKAHTTCIAVGWGFNAPDALKAHTPDAIVYNPGELVDAIVHFE
jgi:phosphoglycolate phosphatase